MTTSHKNNLLLILQPELPYSTSASKVISYSLPYQQIEMPFIQGSQAVHRKAVNINPCLSSN
jgi:hypothetical protein